MFAGDEDVDEAPRRDGTEENSIESDEEKRLEVSPSSAGCITSSFDIIKMAQA